MYIIGFTMMLLYFGFLLAAESIYCRANEVERDTLEQRIEKLEEQLKYGGKQFQTVPLNSARQLKDHDYLSLQFLGARDAWLGCTDSVCDLRTCPSRGDNYRNFDTICSGERFQIIGKGTNASPITSGQKIRLRSLRESNTYMGCSFNNRCDKRTCPGTTSEAKNFNRCSGEIFEIYAHNRNIGDTIYNGDVVMLYFPRTGRYVSIQGQDDKDDTSLNFCPGLAPPAYLSYGICSKNTFRIYRKP